MQDDDLEDEEPLDDEPFVPVREGGVVQSSSLAFVCVLSLVVGGVAALALYHTRQGAAEVRGVAGKSADVGRGAGAGAAAVESPAGGGARVEDAQTWAAGDEDNVETVVSSGKAGRPRAAVRARAGAGERAGDYTGAPRRYARASGRQVAAGGRGVGGHALGGVKKTGEGVKKTGALIGKTFGKVGGVFHD
jgi:hypothetical protein